MEPLACTLRFGPLVGLTPQQIDTDAFVNCKVGLEACEVLAKPAAEIENIEAFFSEYATNSNALMYVEFVTRQIDFAIAAGVFGWINLAPEAIERSQVRDVLLATLCEVTATSWRGKPTYKARYDTIGFELVESAEISVAAQSFLRTLRDAGYPIAIDDVGAGVHADLAYLKTLIMNVQPQKLKIDMSLVTADAMVPEGVNLLKQLPMTAIEGLTLEGVEHNPHAHALQGRIDHSSFTRAAQKVFLFGSGSSGLLASWMGELQEKYNVHVSAQLAPLEEEDLLSVL